MSETTTYRWSLLDDVNAYREAGYSAIALWRPKLTEFGEERGIELLLESGLAVSSLSWAGGFTGSSGHSYREVIEDARDAIRTAAALRAACVVVVSGARAGHTRNHARRLLIDALMQLADLAAEHGVKLALQPMHRMFSLEWTFLTTIDETCDILAACQHPAVQMAFNVYHLWREPQLVERISAIAPRVATVQLSDWGRPPRSELDRCLPGDGEIPLREITSEFVRSGYRGYFEIEVWSEELWNSDYVDLLKTCRSRFDSLRAPQR